MIPMTINPAFDGREKNTDDYKAAKVTEEGYLEASIRRLEVMQGLGMYQSFNGFTELTEAFREWAPILATRQMRALRLHIIREMWRRYESPDSL